MAVINLMMYLFKSLVPILVYLLYAIDVSGQGSYQIMQHDTTLTPGTKLTLCIDSTKAYSNFIFSAKDPSTDRWTIWRRYSNTGKYEPIFNDSYNRMNVAVAQDKKEMLYVRYKPQKDGAMYMATMDSAWVCKSDIDGYNETALFLVPQFNKNAIYDIDWSTDKKRVLYSYGNDEYPNLTRDGDIFEYIIADKAITNLTNDWQLWSKNCRYSPDGNAIAYSHFANFWNALPTDIFEQKKGQNRQEITTATNQDKYYQFCTLTDYTDQEIIFRRGLYFDNKLYTINRNNETQLPAPAGYGGIKIANDLYAATDFDNNIILFTSKKVAGKIHISGINNFAKDNTYNFALDCNTRLNWMEKQKVKVRWSNGDTAFTVNVQPSKSTTYYCKVTVNGTTYEDSIHIKIKGKIPQITKNCLTLFTSGYRTYQWLHNKTAIQGATDSAYTPQSGGSYAVMATDKKGRTMTSEEITINDKEADSTEMLNQQIKIIADPSTSRLKIEAPFILNIVIINDRGQTVIQQNNINEIDMNNLNDGVYDILFYSNNCIKLRSKRVVKKSN